MTLSGNLFAKLLEGRSILFSRFLWNRVIRLVPIMVINGVMRYFKGESLEAYLLMIPVCWLSYQFIKLPFLRFRTQYMVR